MSSNKRLRDKAEDSYSVVGNVRVNYIDEGVATIFPPDWGMLRRSRCVQRFLINSRLIPRARI